MDDDPIILEIDDDLYEALARMAAKDGMSVDEKAAEIITASVLSDKNAKQETRPDRG